MSDTPAMRELTELTPQRVRSILISPTLSLRRITEMKKKLSQRRAEAAAREILERNMMYNKMYRDWNNIQILYQNLNALK
jgi:hypothetical protein